ncbi:MAG: hypothetical protein EOM87_08965 [Clostridia bacterium]|nr:hypothetical protein [Clostridia bacterium]
MYGRTGIALVDENNSIGIEFYFNDVFYYKPSNSYVQLSIDTNRENRKAEALEALGIGKKPKDTSKDIDATNTTITKDNKNTEPQRELTVENMDKNIKEAAAEDLIISDNRKYNLDDYIRMNEIKNSDSPYRSTLDTMFGSRNDNIVADTISPKAMSSEITIATSSYADLKERLMRVGYKLRPYVKQTTSSYYSMNFIFSNKIKRDCYTFLYFAMLIEIFIGYFFVDRFAGIGFVSYISTAAALLIVPIYGWVNYMLHPDKRIRAQFDFKIAIAGVLMLYVNLLVITILLGFFAFTSDIYSVESMIVPIFYPAALLLNLPLAVIIFNILYKTNRYHLH